MEGYPNNTIPNNGIINVVNDNGGLIELNGGGSYGMKLSSVPTELL